MYGTHCIAEWLQSHRRIKEENLRVVRKLLSAVAVSSGEDSVQLISTCAVKAEKQTRLSQDVKTRVPIQGSEHEMSYSIVVSISSKFSFLFAI